MVKENGKQVVCHFLNQNLESNVYSPALNVADNIIAAKIIIVVHPYDYSYKGSITICSQEWLYLALPYIFLYVLFFGDPQTLP